MVRPRFRSDQDPAVTLSSIEYDAAGRVWKSVDGEGNTTRFVYNDAGQRTHVIDADLKVSRYLHDANGNVRFFTDAKNRTTEYSYDNLNRHTKTIFPATEIDLSGALQTTTTEIVTLYDQLDRRIGEYEQSPSSAPLSQRKLTRFGYDTLGRLAHVIDPANQITSYTFDEAGNQLTQTDANQHTTRYTYDNAGRRLTRTLPLGQTEQMQYDNLGNLRYRTDFNGKTTEFTYDEMSRLRFKTPDPSLSESTVEFTYCGCGLRETMADGSGLTSYFYDDRGRLKTKATPFGTLTYTHDGNDNLKSVTSGNPDGASVEYRYDSLRRLQHVIDANIGTTSYSYDQVGNLDEIRYPNGVKQRYTYSEINRLSQLQVTDLQSAILGSFTYTGDPAGRRMSTQEAIAGGTTQSGMARSVKYQYDNLGRLKRETITAVTAGLGYQPGPLGSIGYTLDNIGNRSHRSSSVAGINGQSFTYNDNDRIIGHLYDNNGNTINAPLPIAPSEERTPVQGSDSYTFEDRLETRQGTSGSNVRMVYDGDGNLVQQIIAENGTTQTISYLIDTLNPTGHAQVLEEQVNGVVIKVYTYGLDLITQDVRNGSGSFAASFFGYDGHGSVRFLTNESGQLTDHYTYEAFGDLIHKEGSTSNDYLFSGERYFSELGLYHLRARFMSAGYGRFWSTDTWEGDVNEPPTLHKYLYANADPLNFNDPSGLASNTTELGIGQAIINATRIAFVAGARKIGMRAVKKISCEIGKGQIVSGLYLILVTTADGSGVPYLYVGQAKNIKARIAKWVSVLSKESRLVQVIELVAVRGGKTKGAQKFIREIAEAFAINEVRGSGYDLPGNTNNPIDPSQARRRKGKHFPVGDPLEETIEKLVDILLKPICK